MPGAHVVSAAGCTRPSTVAPSIRPSIGAPGFPPSIGAPGTRRAQVT
jgi:hypothetical protein